MICFAGSEKGGKMKKMINETLLKKKKTVLIRCQYKNNLLPENIHKLLSIRCSQHNFRGDLKRKGCSSCKTMELDLNVESFYSCFTFIPLSK